MTKRDAKGRFTKGSTINPNDEDRHRENWFWIVTTLGLLAILAMVYMAGYTIGHSDGYTMGFSDGNLTGYSQGVSNNQPLVWLDGFNKGQKYPNVSLKTVYYDPSGWWGYTLPANDYCAANYKDCRILSYEIDESADQYGYPIPN